MNLDPHWFKNHFNGTLLHATVTADEMEELIRQGYSCTFLVTDSHVLNFRYRVAILDSDPEAKGACEDFEFN